MSNNRKDYASSSEWLTALRQDYTWLCQLQQLQTATADEFGKARDTAMRKLGQGLTFEYWDTLHDVERAVREVWEEAELSLVSLKMQTIGMLMLEWLAQHEGGVQSVPDRLRTREAKEVMNALVDANLLIEGWKPNHLSGTERALVAKTVCECLEINEVWQVFGQLWGEKPETLRSYMNKALDQKKSLRFQDRLKDILR